MSGRLLLFAMLTLACGGGARTGADAATDASADAPGADTSSDAPGVDTTGDGAVSCNPGAVAFPRGGTLAPGTLCDELYACADDAAGAARIEAASPRFSCTPGSEPESTCTAFTASSAATA